MPNRILREGIITSERIDMLDPEEEVFYRRLMSLVDDFGRYTANATLLVSAAYPLRIRRVADEDIVRWLGACQRANLVRVYSVDSKQFLELIDFKQQVRSKESKYPSPDVGVPFTCVADAKQTKSNAHLDGDGDGDVFEDVSGDGDGGVGVGGEPISRSVQIAVFLRRNGIDGANGSNPLIMGWAANPRVNDDLLQTAVAMVKDRKPTRPGPKYMAPIIEELLMPREAAKARDSPGRRRTIHDERAETIAAFTGKTRNEPDHVIEIDARRIG